MPLIILCGYPSSGKTTLGNQLKSYLECEHQKTVKVVSENALVDDAKNSIFADSGKEKSIRSSLRGEVERYISRDNVVILDGLNYIKSLRYELHCIVKAEKTLHCVLFCGIPKDQCWLWNQSRDSGGYTQEIFDAIIMRFEEPDSQRRWDSPLFIKSMETDIDFNAVYEALFTRNAPPPNQSTIAVSLSSGNFMRDLDQVTQSVVMEVLEIQKTAMLGDTVKVKNTTEPLLLKKILNMAELRRIKRQFITYAKMHPVEDLDKLRNMFVQFLNDGMH